MELAELIEGQDVRLHQDGGSMRIHRIVDDSRRAGPGVLFVARAGSRADGRQYIADAVDRGAAAVLSREPIDAPASVAVLTPAGGDPAAAGLALARRLHGDPAAKLRLIGITGTNGKTTTAFMVRHLLTAAGRKCGLMGTVEIDDGATRRPADLTTPGPLELIEILAAMVRHGCDSAVMEVSSHALDQGRAEGLSFVAGMFTNLTGDHLDYHGTMDRYAAAKKRLLSGLSDDATVIVNVQDPYAEMMLDGVASRRCGFGVDDIAAPRIDAVETWLAGIHETTVHDTDCTFRGPWGELAARLPLIGRHNVLNMQGALLAVASLGIEVGELAEAIESCPPVPGRLESVTLETASPPFAVLVDYAHTDDAMVNVLRALRPLAQGRLRVMFGCGGDRDPSKRPRMAAAACRWADEVMITSDNPRTEDAQAIIREILAGVPAEARERVQVQPDRARAIPAIIADARPGDIVLLAGKGHEDYQIIGAQKRPFDDRLHARQALKDLARTWISGPTTISSR